MTGSIGVGQAGELNGTVTTAAPSYDLTGLGRGDWIHRGRANNFANYDRKSGVTPLITNVATIGAGEAHGVYYNVNRRASWSDGTPTASVVDDIYYAWSNGATNSGFQFTVKADTTERTLYFWGGGDRCEGTLWAHLSDASAADYVDVQSVAAAWHSLYTINYRADSPNQTLTITYLKTSTNGIAPSSTEASISRQPG